MDIVSLASTKRMSGIKTLQSVRTMFRSALVIPIKCVGHADKSNFCIHLDKSN